MSRSKTIEYLENKLKKHQKKKKKKKVARKKEIIKYLGKADKQASCEKKYEKLLAKYEGLKKENKTLKAQFKQIDPTERVAKNGIKPEKRSNRRKEMAPILPDTPIMTAPKPKEEEGSILQRIQEKASSVNFDRIGKASQADKDDLKRIKGIGPMIEGRLNALGIYTFEQISKFSPKDEVIVNEAIEYFQGRISRDNWVEQATSFIENRSS